MWITAWNQLYWRANWNRPVGKPSKRGVQTIEERCVNRRNRTPVGEPSKEELSTAWVGDLSNDQGSYCSLDELPGLRSGTV